MKVVTIGKSNDNAIVINDNYVSRWHCQITQDNNGKFCLLDRNSKNGTFVNGRRVTGEVYLNQMDVVKIGNSPIPWQSYFTEYVGDGYPPPPPPPPPPPIQQQKSGGFGIAAFICGLLGASCLLAIVFGIIGMQRDRKNKGLAIAGFILGCIWFVVCIIWWIVVATAVSAVSYYPYY